MVAEEFVVLEQKMTEMKRILEDSWRVMAGVHQSAENSLAVIEKACDMAREIQEELGYVGDYTNMTNLENRFHQDHAIIWLLAETNGIR